MQVKTRDGVVKETTDFQERLLSALYGNVPGRLLLKPLTAPVVSKAAGALLSTKASRVLIKPFIRSNGIDMSQFLPVEYGSYNEFFSREIRPEARTVDRDPRHLISPCDSKLTVLPVTRDGRFRLKQTEYTLESLLRNRALAQEYEGGTLLIFRLCVED